MAKKQDKVSKAGAVALEENQLDDAQGGILMPPTRAILIGAPAMKEIVASPIWKIPPVIKF